MSDLEIDKTDLSEKDKRAVFTGIKILAGMGLRIVPTDSLKEVKVNKI